MKSLGFFWLSFGGMANAMPLNSSAVPAFRRLAAADSVDYRAQRLTHRDGPKAADDA
jgi:hypothetical protein